MPISQKLPLIRVPALIGGEVVSFHVSQVKNQWTAVCCPARLGLVESMFLDRYHATFLQHNGTLLGLNPRCAPFHLEGILQPRNLKIAMLADPLGRISRALKISDSPGPPRCQSFIINPHGAVACHLAHDLDGRGMGTLLEIFSSQHLSAFAECDPDAYLMSSQSEERHSSSIDTIELSVGRI